jgi:hypothetical protein
MTTVGFKNSETRGLKNSATTFQQPVMTDLIDGPTWPPIGTPSTTTQSSGLALGEIQTTNPKESARLGVAIRKWSIPPASTQWSTGPQWQNAAPLHQVALHFNLDFSMIRLQGQTCGTDRGWAWSYRDYRDYEVVYDQGSWQSHNWWL